MTLTHPKTVIKRDDMARIFELIESGVGVVKISMIIGYDYRTVRRGVVIAKLFGYEAVK